MAVKTDELKNKLAKRVNGSGGDKLRPIDRLKAILSAESVQEQFRNALQENAGAFVASIIDLYNTDANLRLCDPSKVVMEALKAASLKLPINRQLGFAWIVPYKDKNGEYIPTFQLGYKGYIQLALRTGAYRYINADVVYEGELVRRDRLTGEIEIDPDARTSDKVVGYFAFLETLNGFRKTVYMTVDEVRRHAERFSKSYRNPSSPWHTDFDSMALKTCMRQLLSRYGIMSIELQRAYIEDSADVTGLADAAIAGEEQADGNVIDADYEVHEGPAEAEQPDLEDEARQQQGLGI
nr:MAG: recombinase [Sphaerobacter thermophilus]